MRTKYGSGGGIAGAMPGQGALVMLSVLNIAAPAAGWAQDATTGQAEMGEIVVTAQKRSERLLDVPMSISAFSSQDLEQRGATKLADIQYSIPGFSIQPSAGSYSSFQLRGISGRIGRSVVGEYFDEMPVIEDLTSQRIRVNVVDMESIEVLRGPQATLYGESSMGGTIRYVTASPDLKSASARVSGEVGSIDQGGTNYRGAAIVNAPLVEGKAGIRAVAAAERGGGWIDSLATGESNWNHDLLQTFRAKLLVKPTEAISISLLGLYQTYSQDHQNTGIDGKSIAKIPEYTRDRLDLVNATINYDFGPATLINSTGYFRDSKRYVFDLGPVFIPVLEAFGAPPGFFTSIGSNDGIRLSEAFTEDIRLVSNGANRLKWIAGASYRDSKSRDGYTAIVEPVDVPDIYSLHKTGRSGSYSLYAQGDYSLPAGVTLTAGLRYYHDHQNFSATSATFGPVPPVGPLSANFHASNPKVSIREQLSPYSMIYATAAKGFRSGGFNAVTTPGTPVAYGPDSLWTYEVGTKQQMLDRKLFIDGAVYRTDWTNVQTVSYVPNNPNPPTTSGGLVKGWGVDLSVSARPIEPVLISATYGWNNLRHKRQRADVIPGDRLDFALEDSFTIAVEAQHPLTSAIKGLFRADYAYAGRAFNPARSSGVVGIIEPHRKLDAAAGVDLGHVELELFATNITNDHTPYAPRGLSIFYEDTEQEPRVIGIRVSASLSGR